MELVTAYYITEDDGVWPYRIVGAFRLRETPEPELLDGVAAVPVAKASAFVPAEAITRLDERLAAHHPDFIELERGTDIHDHAVGWTAAGALNRE